MVHNDEVINFVKSKGVKVISGNKEEAIDSIDFGVVVFSAHGTSDKIIQKAIDKGLVVYDAACPFVKKELLDIKKYIEKDYDVLFIGVPGHDEANAVLSISSKIHLIARLSDVEQININNKNSGNNTENIILNGSLIISLKFLFAKFSVLIIIHLQLQFLRMHLQNFLYLLFL